MWTGNDGQFWLFGGSTSPEPSTFLSDLWVYDPGTNLWTWKKGTMATNQLGSYGVQGQAAPTNNPSSRSRAVTWVGLDGKLWLFGGYGWDASGGMGWLNDLWNYDPASNLWTWVSGSKLHNQNGIYGTRGVASSTNAPGGRVGPSTWRDPQGRFWLLADTVYPAARMAI
jgi:N-acetylneuraminic acid mutarotase